MDNQAEQSKPNKIHLTYEGDKLTVDVQGGTKNLVMLLGLSMKHCPDLKYLIELALLVNEHVENIMSNNEPPQDTGEQNTHTSQDLPTNPFGNIMG